MIKTITYLVYNSYYIALCAVGLTSMSMHYLSLSVIRNIELPLFIFCTTLLAYRFHYIYKKKKEIPDVRSIHLTNARKLNYVSNIILIILACSCFSYFNPAQMILILCIITLTILYTYPLLPAAYFSRNKIKSYGYIKPFYLALVWTLCTVVLPMLNENAKIDFPPIITTYFFMLSLCILFDLKDIQIDLAQGIITIPQLISGKALFSIIMCIILLNNIYNVLHLNEWNFALLITSMIQIWVTNGIIFKTPEQPFLYLFRVDGLMLIWCMIYFILQFSTIWQ